MAIKEYTKNLFIEQYPTMGKKWCIENLKISDSQVRYYAQKFNLVSKFKFNDAPNYNRGSGFRGEKRPDHSKYLIDNHPLKGKHHKESTKKLISESNKLAHKEGRKRSDYFTGHKHTASSIEKIRNSALGRKYDDSRTEKILATKIVRYGRAGGFSSITNTYSRCKRGHYDINGVDYYFRSLWEANYALYLDFLVKNNNIIAWEFEPDVFWFNGIKRGVMSYLPDFKVTNNDGSIEYHEVKGWMDDKSKTKIKRMAKYHPNIKLLIIDGPCYKNIIKNAPIKFY